MHYGTTTKLSPEEVIEKAIDYFGKLGLEVTGNEGYSLLMQGGGGYIDLSVYVDGDTEVDVVTQEWSEQVKQFLQRIG